MILSQPPGYKIEKNELLIKAEDLRQRLINDTRFEDSVILRDLMYLVRIGKEEELIRGTLDSLGGRQITSLKDLVKTHGGPVGDAAIRDLEACNICKAIRGAPCRTSSLQTRLPHPGRKSIRDSKEPGATK